MSLNELVDMYNQQLTNNQSRSTLATDLSHHTPQSTFQMNNGFDSVPNGINSNNMTSFTQNASASLLFETGTERFHLNDRVLAGDIVRPGPHQNKRVERIKHSDTIVFSSGDNEIQDYEHNEEYTKKYPDNKSQLNIISAQQARIPLVNNLFTNPREQIQHLISQGQLKNLHGYINYPYNYLEPPWHYSPLEEQQGFVNLNPPRTHLTEQDIASNTDDTNEIILPHGIPQEVISQDRYELVPLPKLVYEHFVPLIATRRIVCRRPIISDNASSQSCFPHIQDSSLMASQLPQVDEMTYQF